MGVAMSGTRLWALGPLLALGAGVACGETVVAPAASPAISDAKAVLQQELGEMPAPKGPCPERTQQDVLTNPRAPVQRTALGLAYCFLQEGPPGVAVPGQNDTVRVNYSGWTLEGKLFDSSIERGEPMDLALNAVIRGWSEGLRLMTPGDKARLWIPGNLGYGAREPGAEAGTPPRGTIVFDIELIEIMREAVEPPPGPPPEVNPNADLRPNLGPKKPPPEELTEGQRSGHAKKPRKPPE
jgi:FKBP-type peptidyl-prolyl cis-trans isomerase